MKQDIKQIKYSAKTIKIISTLAILLTLAFGAAAQSSGTVAGRVVTTNATSELAKDLSVKLYLRTNNNIFFTTRTGANGDFRFENIPPGEYILVAEPVIDDANLKGTEKVEVKAGQTVAVNLELTLEAQAPYKVLVNIAEGSNQDFDEEVSKSVSVVSSEELQNRNEIDVANALRTIPGLRVQQLGGFGRVVNIKTRGLRNQDTAVLIDGQRFRDPAAITGDASPFLSDLMISNVERIEVLRGSGSSLYGTNAIGGVFDIRTEEPGNDLRGNLLSEGGGLGMFRGKASVSAPILKNKLWFGLGASHTNFADGIDDNDASRNTTGQARIDFTPTDNSRLSTRLYAADAFVQLNSNPSRIGTLPATGVVRAVPLSRAELRRFETGTPRSQLNVGDATFMPDADNPNASQAGRFFNGQVNFTHTPSAATVFNVSYQGLTTRRKNLSGALRNLYDGQIHTLNTRFDWVANRAHQLTFGYEFEHEKFGNDNFEANPAFNNQTDVAQRSNTLFVQDRISLFDDRLQMSGAFRTQFFSLLAPRFSADSPYRNARLDNPPNAYTFDGSAAYVFRSTGTKLRAHVGNGYRVPSLYERFGAFYNTFIPVPRFDPSGAPNLEPERSIAFDGGFDQTFKQNRVRLSATYFYTRLIDTIGFTFGFTNDPYGRTGGYFNNKGGVSRGAEFSAELRPFATTQLFASYTYTNSDQREPQVAGSGVIASLFIPAHQFTFVATQTIFNRLTLNFDFVATNSYLGTIFPRVYRFEGQRRGDLTAGYAVPVSSEKLRLRLFGTIENIFNRDYYENGFRTPRATARGGLQLNF